MGAEFGRLPPPAREGSRSDEAGEAATAKTDQLPVTGAEAIGGGEGAEPDTCDPLAAELVVIDALLARSEAAIAAAKATGQTPLRMTFDLTAATTVENTPGEGHAVLCCGKLHCQLISERFDVSSVARCPPEVPADLLDSLLNER